MSKGLSPETVNTIVDVGFSVARYLTEAFANGDEEKIRRLADVLPPELKSKLALQLGEEKARAEFDRMAHATDENLEGGE